MKFNKWTIGIAALAAAVITLTGCVTKQTVTQTSPGVFATNTVTTIDPVRTSAAIHSIVPGGVELAVSKAPNVRPYIVDAQVAICSLTDSTNLSPDALKAVVAQTGIQQIQTPEIETVIASVYGLYSAYYGDVINQQLDKNAQTAALVPVLQAICESLGEGLAQSAPPLLPSPSAVSNAVIVPNQ
jgi:hypothetical protein